MSSDGVVRPEHEYLEMSNEYVDPNNTSKWSRLSRESYAVGPLARFNNNYGYLHSDARRVAAAFGLEPVCHNPFMANVARLVEMVHCAHDAIRLIDALVEETEIETMCPVPPTAGRGVGAVEAPRGILFHCFDYNTEGRIEQADCVVPTTQNNGNIHRDLPSLVTAMTAEGADDERLELMCAMLVRSYDPCISCSVH
jgi:coenzyme F420-reducing hydrogenase alpha subunit